MRFDIIVLHYSLFGRGHAYELTEDFNDYIMSSVHSIKIAFFQDEYRYCQKRFEFINNYDIHTIYTCVEEQYHHLVYGKFTKAKKIITYIPGYVSSDLVRIASRFAIDRNKRSIDIGYRARKLDYYMGKEAQEKHLIGLKFLEKCTNRQLPLIVDIDVNEKGRIYGDNWYRFMGNCKGMIGVESGVSIFDLYDEVRVACELLTRQNSSITFEEVYEKILYKWENNVPLRTVSPRHFEAAAFKSCQILFEGNYSGILKPDIHFIPLKKDFSNFDEAIRKFSDINYCDELTRNAYSDVILSGAYSYKQFILSFDRHLKGMGASHSGQFDSKVVNMIKADELERKLKIYSEKLRNYFS